VTPRSVSSWRAVATRSLMGRCDVFDWQVQLDAGGGDVVTGSKLGQACGEVALDHAGVGVAEQFEQRADECLWEALGDMPVVESACSCADGWETMR
jgi:hypothetical protein